jgi:hypothetical protein
MDFSQKENKSKENMLDGRKGEKKRKTEKLIKCQ